MSTLKEVQKSSVCDVRELEKLLPELQEKMIDIKDTKASYTEKLKAMKVKVSNCSFRVSYETVHVYHE